jgi:manganese/iron transport system permease protein/iron/zinc/copper transport system permease protein
VIDWLAQPWSFAFFRHGMIAATLAGGLAGLVGIYVVLRRMSYIGHGLSHAILGGAVVGYIANASFYVTGGIWGAVSALMITGVSRSRKIGADAAIGIITTASYAVGIALISRGHHFTRNFEAAFFGNILGVTTSEVWLLVAVAIAVAVTIFFFYKQLLFVTFDPEVASSFGVRTVLVDSVFSLVLAASIIATMRILGVTLIAAAIVTPAVVARLSTDSFSRMLLLSVGVGALCGFGGMYVSYYGDIASGATITLFGAAVFAVVYLGGLARGRFSRARRGDQTAADDPGEGLVGFAARATALADIDIH